MTIFKAGDKVRVKQGAYNISDHRWERSATVSRIDLESKLLPVRIEYDAFSFNWTNHESLELIETAPDQNTQIGKEILDRMRDLKTAVLIRDEAVKNVVEQTETLDALLASVGLKRGEEVSPIPIRVTGPRTALDDVADKTVEEGQRYRCTANDVDWYTKDKVYTVEALDLRDNEQPISFIDDDGDETFPQRYELKYFIRVN